MLLLNPEVARRSCGDCVAYLHHDQGPGKFGKVVRRGGRPVPRLTTHPPPCRWCPKIPTDADPKPENAEELSEKNTRAYLHYLECKAVGVFPDDGLVRTHARLIADAERHRDLMERHLMGGGA